MKRKVGRPRVPKQAARSRFISTRLSPEEYKRIEAAIKQSGTDKTEWVRKTLLSAASGGNG